jgi:hypothetical protein
MSDFAVTVDYSKVEQMMGFITTFPEHVRAAVRRAAVAGMGWIKRGTPYEFGAAQRSWELVQVDDLSFSVASITGAGAEYTPFLENGTFKYGPFGVMPKTAFERTRTGAPTAAAKKIKGGYRGAHMVENNMSAIETRLNEEMQREYEKVVGK